MSMGHLIQDGVKVTRKRVRESLDRVDSEGREERKLKVIKRREYQSEGPMHGLVTTKWISMVWSHWGLWTASVAAVSISLALQTIKPKLHYLCLSKLFTNTSFARAEFELIKEGKIPSYAINNDYDNNNNEES